MLRKSILTIIQTALPVLPGLYLLRTSGAGALAPWPVIVGFILCVNLLLMLFGWRYLGEMRGERQSRALLLVLSVFEPILTWWLLLEGDASVSPAGRIAIYCAGQALLWISLDWAPDLSGRLLQRRWERKVLSGERKFPSRKAFLEERERRSGKSSGSD